jgi:hypothetical protein
MVSVCLAALLSLSLQIQSQTPPTGLQVSPTNVDFGESSVDSDGPARTVIVSNPTKSAITLEQVITSGIDFSEKNDCGKTLAPGANCTIQVFFTPAISGSRTGNLDIMGSDLGSPHFVALTGTGK